jgi:hypothetical protein
MPSPLKRRHSRHHGKLVSWLDDYEVATPGVEAYDHATVILGPESEHSRMPAWSCSPRQAERLASPKTTT